MELATVNNQTMAIKEYKGQRVLTFKDIDTAHNRPNGTASRAFRANRKHFIENVDYYRIKSADFQPDEIRRFGINSPNGAIVITESGYLMLAKSFTDELAWTVQRELVNCYFRNKPQTAVPTKGEQLTLETSEYFYFDKKYNGKPVLSAADVEHFTGIKLHKIRQCLKTFCEKHIDYILLEGPWLAQYKAQNPNVSKLASAELVVTKSGFVKLMKFCDCKVDTPKCFIEEKKPVIATETSIPAPQRVNSDECIIALNVLRYLKSRYENMLDKSKSNGEKCMIEHYNNDIASIKATMKSVGVLVGAGY